jgi:hypothetical protein
VRPERGAGRSASRTPGTKRSEGVAFFHHPFDAIRCAKLARERGKGGVLDSASAYFMKHPPRQFTDAEA